MEPHSPKSPRYSDTPPGSPKSCMKGSRKLTFDKPAEPDPSPVPSPKRSPRTPKSVSIRMHGDGSGGGEGSPRTSFDLPSTSSVAVGPSTSSSAKKTKTAPPEIQFQFELTEHFDQSTPPPNCTSNGNYDFEKESQEQSGTTTYSSQDLRKDPQLVEIANKFVNEIIENAKVEAASRAKADPTRVGGAQGTTDGRDPFSNGMGRGAAGWYRRAHGLVSKWITNICVRAQNIRADLK